MNVLQIPRRFVKSEWGGTETVVLETAKRLLAKNVLTEIYTSMALAEQTEEIIEGVTVRRFPYFYPYWGLSREAKKRLDQKGGNLFSFSLMCALQRYPGLQLIHLHTGKRMGAIGRYVARKRKIPYLISLHGGVLDVPAEEAQTWTDPTARAVEWGKLLGWWAGSRRVLDDAAAILCVGQEERNLIQQQYPNKNVIYLPNGVDCARFARGDGAAFREKYQIPFNAIVMLTVGRIDPQKNQAFVFELLPEIVHRCPEALWVIIGPSTNDSYYANLNRICQAAPFDRRCILIPGVSTSSPDLVNAYHAADLFLLPSIHEPFGIVVLEAWAAGLPVIASRTGGLPFFIDHECDGLLLPVNQASDWINGVNSLLTNRELRQSLGSAGNRKVIQSYDWNLITDQLLSIYQTTIQSECHYHGD